MTTYDNRAVSDLLRNAANSIDLAADRAAAEFDENPLMNAYIDTVGRLSPVIRELAVIAEIYENDD